MFTILVLLPNPNIVTAVNGIVATAFGNILFNLFYYNLSSKYITSLIGNTIVDLLMG